MIPLRTDIENESNTLSLFGIRPTGLDGPMGPIPRFGYFLLQLLLKPRNYNYFNVYYYVLGSLSSVPTRVGVEIAKLLKYFKRFLTVISA